MRNEFRKNECGITLIVLVITIVILLILAGIAILQLTDNGIFEKAKFAKDRTEYTSAKEILDMKLMEIQTECIYEQKEFEITEIVKNIEKCNDITIEKYYMENIASTIVDLPENLINLKGIVVSVNQYVKYKFLIGNNSKIIGVITGEIPNKMEDFKTLEEFEKDLFEKYLVGTDVKFYLYNEGKVNDGVGEFIGIKDRNAEYKTNEKNYLYTNANSSGYNISYIGTKNKVNLMDYTKIKCLVTTGDAIGGSNAFRLTLNNTQLPSALNFGVYYKQSNAILANQMNQVFEWEISEEDRQKEYYIGFAATLKNVYVYKIWLEK